MDSPQRLAHLLRRVAAVLPARLPLSPARRNELRYRPFFALSNSSAWPRRVSPLVSLLQMEPAAERARNLFARSSPVAQLHAAVTRQRDGNRARPSCPAGDPRHTAISRRPPHYDPRSQLRSRSGRYRDRPPFAQQSQAVSQRNRKRPRSRRTIFSGPPQRHRRLPENVFPCPRPAVPERVPQKWAEIFGPLHGDAAMAEAESN